jgi:hypothetical protein
LQIFPYLRLLFIVLSDDPIWNPSALPPNVKTLLVFGGEAVVGIAEVCATGSGGGDCDGAVVGGTDAPNWSIYILLKFTPESIVMVHPLTLLGGIVVDCICGAEDCDIAGVDGG